MAGGWYDEAGAEPDEANVIADPAHVARARVLFICTGNTARSQMAEGFLRGLAGERFDAYSAGLEPGELDPLAVQVTEECGEERGIDVSGQRAKGLDEYLGKLSFAYVITVCDRAAQYCPFFPGAGERLHWSFEHPAEVTGSDMVRLAKLREVGDLIEAVAGLRSEPPVGALGAPQRLSSSSSRRFRSMPPPNPVSAP
jgi:arsenate reductase